MRFRYTLRRIWHPLFAREGPHPKAEQPKQAFQERLAVDVGGVCWGVDGVEQPVLDHRFYRERPVSPPPRLRCCGTPSV